MKLNYDCIRDVLLSLEELLTLNDCVSENEICTCSMCHPYNEDDIIYSLVCLDRANLIIASFLRGDGKISAIGITDITPSGYNFIENIREDKKWDGLKTLAKKAGVASLSTFAQMASNETAELIKGLLHIT